MQEPEILFEQRGHLGLITLNRPEALNALTYGMIQALDAQLEVWEHDPTIAVVAIQGAGDKAFAAGGDIRWLYENGQGGASGERNFAFFADEYRLNTRIKRYPKPYIAIMDGIVMGGGVGVSIHGSIRIATERTVFAMPETGIGLFPDVGATWFLPRLPGQTGLWLGLTGARLKGDDVVRAGICDYFLGSENIEWQLDWLAEGRWMSPPAGRDLDILSPSACTYVTMLPPGLAQQKEIDGLFANGTLETTLENLRSVQTEWAAKQRSAILSKSPTSIRIAFRQIREGAKLSFEDCMRLEYRLARYCMTHPDFYEGVRALIID
ncbi:MAG: enoyl-CoA hydratase/isomerase family protein, partial [Pseudomonadota bacterium]